MKFQHKTQNAQAYIKDADVVFISIKIIVF